MGCDIHMRCEVLSRNNGTWEDADYYRKIGHSLMIMSRLIICVSEWTSLLLCDLVYAESVVTRTALTVRLIMRCSQWQR